MAPTDAGTAALDALATAGLRRREAAAGRLSRRPGRGEPERLARESADVAVRGASQVLRVVAGAAADARAAGHPVGPGHGDTAGSLLAYALGLTDVHPLDFGLHWERVLHGGPRRRLHLSVPTSRAGRHFVAESLRRDLEGGPGFTVTQLRAPGMGWDALAVPIGPGGRDRLDINVLESDALTEIAVARRLEPGVRVDCAVRARPGDDPAWMLLRDGDPRPLPPRLAGERGTSAASWRAAARVAGLVGVEDLASLLAADFLERRRPGVIGLFVGRASGWRDGGSPLCAPLVGTRGLLLFHEQFAELVRLLSGWPPMRCVEASRALRTGRRAKETVGDLQAANRGLAGTGTSEADDLWEWLPAAGAATVQRSHFVSMAALCLGRARLAAEAPGLLERVRAVYRRAGSGVGGGSPV